MAASAWDEIIKAKKGVRTSDQQACGNIISEDGNNIVISEGAVKTHRYVVPKNKVDNYSGTEIQLNISYNELTSYESAAAQKSDEQEREFEEGAAGTKTDRKKDPLKEYDEKEAMSPAKEKEHEPTAVKGEMTEKITEPGQTATNPEEAKEISRKKGMAKGTAGAAETGSEYEQGAAGTSK